ncbi:UNVERIFIED_CONTAM: putative pyridoxine 5'-phosphate oxidase superfamily flavin-nucleotide-binding protein [Brevibacillus sp. OAP136]
MEASGEQFLRSKFQTNGIRIGHKLSDLLRRYVESMEFFFLATADRAGNCDCSFRGGVPCVKVLDDTTLIFPDYPGKRRIPKLGQHCGESACRHALHRFHPSAAAANQRSSGAAQ